MNLQNFLSLTINDLRTIYHGKNNGCRCGCRGEYIYPKDTPRMAEVKLKSAQRRALKNPDAVEYHTNFGGEVKIINIPTGQTNAYTIYLKED